MWATPSTRVVRPDGLARARQVPGEGPVQDLVDERALARARHPGHRDERAERERHVDVAQVVLPGALHHERLAVAASPLGGDRDLPLATQVRPGDRARLGQQALQRAVRDDLAAVLPRPGPDVDHPVRRPDRLLVVLHDQHRVAEVAQPGERRDQLRVVPLVEADRRLVEDVQHAHQRRADLRREPDPLRLAAREADARPVDGQVVEPDVHEEAEPGDDLLEDLAADRPLALGDLAAQRRGPVERLGHRQGRDLGDVAPVHGHRERLGPQPTALAGGARLLDHELLELRPDVLGLGLLEPALEVRDDPLERRDVAVLAALVAVAHDDLLVLGRVQQVLDRLVRQVLHRDVDPPAARGEDRLRDLHPPRDLGRHLVPRDQGAGLDAPGAVRDHEVGLDDQLRPEARARRAGAVRRVEREAPRLQLVDRRPVVRAAVALAEPPLLELRRLPVARRRRDDDHALAHAERRLDRVREPRRVRVRHGLAGGRVDRAPGLVSRPVLGRLRPPDDEPVDDDLDRVPLVPVERRRLAQVVLLAVHPHPDEPLLAGALEDAVALGLAVLDQRPEDEQPGPLGHRQHLVHHLADGLALDLAAARRAMRVADPREQEAQVVVDLGDRADGRPRVLRRALLVDRDGRRQPVDLVDVGLLHLAQELARVRAQALDVPPLPLGIDGVEREAALAAAGQPGDDDEAITRERDVDVLEVVLARSAHDDPILGHAAQSTGSA